MENSVNRGKTIFMSIIGVVTLLVAVVGATYAWFQATITGNNTASSLTVKSVNLAITFTDTSVINGVNIAPGWSTSKTFTVANPAGSNNGTVVYNLAWESISNTFVNKADLSYTITGTGAGVGTLAKTTIPSAAGNIISNISVAPGVTHTYTMTINYANTTADQSSDMGKTLTGKLKVTANNVSQS